MMREEVAARMHYRRADGGHSRSSIAAVAAPHGTVWAGILDSQLDLTRC